MVETTVATEPTTTVAPPAVVAPVAEPTSAPVADPAAAAPVSSQPPDGSGQQAAKPSAEEVFDWTTDERYERMWKKDPNGLFKSYRNLEKVHEPAKQELSELKKKQTELNDLAQEFGITPEQLKEVLTEHKGLKDPENLTNQRAGYFGKYLDNPHTSQEVIKAFNDIEQKELQRMYPNMNAEQIKIQVEQSEKIQKLEDANNQYESDKLKSKFSSEIDSNIAKAKKYSVARGFDFTKEVEDELLAFAQKENVPTAYIFSAFVEKYGEQLDKSYADKVQKDQIENLNKNKDGVTLSAGSQAAAPSSSGSIRDRLKAVVGIT